MAIFLYLLLSTLQPMESTTPETLSMNVEIVGVKNTKGHILLAVFRSAEGFPDKQASAFRKERIQATAGTMHVELKNLPPGNYAIALVHDENDNLKLDTGLFGIPKEGFCFSNGAMGTFGPPSFDAAAIPLRAGNLNHKLNVKYW